MQSVECDIKTATHNKVKSKKHKKSLKSNGVCLMVLGTVAIILGLILIILRATIMSLIAEKILDLKADSSIFKLWQKYPVRIPTALTFFNWTNHRDFFNLSIKPKFEEIGPYIFSQDIERVGIIRNNNNTITFKQIHTFHYNNNISTNGNLSDRLITINHFNMLVGHLIKDFHSAIKDVFSEYVSTFDPNYHFETIIDNEILKGSHNLLLELSNYLDFIAPDFPRLDGFGWGKLRHGDPNFDGVYNIANGINRQFEVLNWNYYSATPHYDEPCNQVKGSMGDVFSYPLNKEFITIFSGELCRFIKVYYEEETIVDGVLGYKYSFSKLSLDNGTLHPENKCFCGNNCIPSGLLAVSSCRYNLNGYISLPHYFNADPIYLDPLEGLKPEKEKHESYIIVEPNSMLCLEFKIAIQLNLFLYPVEGISFFDKFPKLYFPILWINMHERIPDQLRKYLKMYLFVPHVIIVISILLITLGIYLACYGIYKFKQFRLLERSQNKILDYIVKVPLNK